MKTELFVSWESRNGDLKKENRKIGSLSPVPQVFLHFSHFLALRILKTKMWTMDGVFATLPVALMK